MSELKHGWKDKEWRAARRLAIKEGRSCEHIATAIGTKTATQVEWMLKQMKVDCAAIRKLAPQQRPATSEASNEFRLGDLRFKMAMLAAIRSGAERAEPCIHKASGGRYVPLVYLTSEGSCGSPAAACAELSNATD